MKPPALRILRSDVSFDRLRFCGSAADHRHARCAGRHDDNRRQLFSASAPAVRRHDQHGWAGTAGDRFNGGQSAGMQAVVQPAIRLQCTSKVSFGSKCEILIWSRCFPLYTRKRTQVRHRAMSEKCQNRTHAERCRTSPCVIATTIHPQTEASPAPVGRNVYNSAMLTALFDKVGIDLLCGDNVCTAAVLVSV